MAVIATPRSYNCYGIAWTLGAGVTEQAVDLPLSLAVASVQITGVFGGATVFLEVSNDRTNWVTAKDKDGEAVSFSVAPTALIELSTAAVYVRARTSGGDGTTALAVTLAAWSA